MQTLWIIVAIIGGIFMLLGFMAIIGGIYMRGLERRKVDAATADKPWWADVAIAIWNFLKKLFSIVINDQHPPSKQMRATGVASMILGALALGGGIYGAIQTNSGNDDGGGGGTDTTEVTVLAPPTS